MHFLESHIAKTWKDIHSSTIFIGASGGLDSTCLAFLLKKLNFKVEVLHVNYQLRGDDSEKDAQFIEEFCAEQSIPFHKNKITLSSQLQYGGNLQELARNFRYDWFNEFLAKNEGSFLALAHHKNDQVETFFLNLSRKSGAMGLAAMLEKNGQFIRPFLPFSKEEIEEYARANELTWREDASNASNKYRRNFLRNSILPILKSQIPSLEESVLLLVDQFQKKQKELETKVEPLARMVEQNQTLNIDDFLQLDTLEQVELLRQLDLPASKVDDLKKLSELENGKKLALSNSRFSSIVKKDDTFYFLRNQTTPSSAGVCEVSAPNFSGNNCEEIKLIIEKVSSLPKTFSKNEIYLDASKVKGELILRKWQIGDRIKPIGMKGSKLISDVIKDAGVSPLQKADVLVVVDTSASSATVAEVHWCVGLCVGRVALASDRGQRIKLVIV
ncbi:MAG: tRNA lysidine(34) synthetase TilS [Fluviicola sp.]|nr:tRNA lysidine(34) synthetase TilS [Fluviicola sp.]